MSKKNINESIRDAWQKSLQNGETIRSIKQKEKSQLDSIVEETRNNVLSHLAESDKGFYRPETSPYHKFRDGDYLRRQRLLEQEAIPGSTSTDAGLSQDVDEERRKREREKRQQEQEQQGRRREEVAAQAASARPSRATDPRRTGTRGSTDGGGFDPSQRNPDEVRNPGRDQAIDNILASTKDQTRDEGPPAPGQSEMPTRGEVRAGQLDAMSDEELAAEVDTQAKTDFGTKMDKIEAKMDKIEADEAEREGLSVADHRERTKKRQGRMKAFDKDKELGRKRMEAIEDKEAEAKRLRRAGKREESIELYAQMQKLRRNTAADRSEYAREGEDVPATTAAGGDGSGATTDITSDEGSISSEDKMDGINAGTVTDTAKDGEDNPNVQRVENPDGTVSVQTTNQLKGDVQDPADVGKTDLATGAITVAEPEQDMSKGGYGIEGNVRKEVPLSNIFPNNSAEFEGKTIKGAPQSYRKKDGSGYVELSVDPKDPSGVRYIRNYQDGRQEVRYASGRVTTLDAQGNEIQAGEEGAANPQIELQRRKIMSDSDLGPMLDSLKQGIDNLKDMESAAPALAGAMSGFSTTGFERTLNRQAGSGNQVKEYRQRQEARQQAIFKRIADKLNIGTDEAEEMFREQLGLPAKTDAEKQATKPATTTDPVTGAEAPTTVPPVIAAPTQAAPPPDPLAGTFVGRPDENRRPNNFVELQQSYNPINKYGVNLFEAKGPLQR